eukprot:scaffold65396_cov73-Phaeocystis_antarctica.AAC.1
MPSRRDESALIAASVRCFHPRPECEPAAPARTESAGLSRKTPCSAHACRQPCGAGGTPRSDCSSL